MSRGPGRFLRWIATLVVRGPGAPFVLGDLEEALRRDLARGMSLGRARRRFLANAVASGLSLARARLPAVRPASVGVSWIDVKLGWRMLGKNPVLTSVAVLSLAVGIPVGMAPVHVMDAFDAPPPVEDGDRLMGLRYRGGRGGLPTTSWELEAWRSGIDSFESLGAMRRMEHNLAPEGGVGAPVAAAEVTASTFPALGTRPHLGRPLQAADGRAGASPVAVLGYEVWRSRFDADPGVLGSTVRVSGTSHTVVGVMPEGFRFPMDEGMWIPLRDEPGSEPGGGTPLQVFGRLAEGVPAATAQAEVTAFHERMAARHPEHYGRTRAEVVSLTTMLLGVPKGGMAAIPAFGPFSVLFVFQALALVLLVVACVNVGLLIFARTAGRSAELSVRTALGASRPRLVGQVVTEALVLALIASGAGLLAMELLAGRMLGALWPPAWGGVPWWIDLGVDRTTVARALALGGFSAAAAAGVPALRATGTDVRGHLRAAGADGFGIRIGALWGALIVADVALAVAAVGLTVGIGTRMEQVATARQMDDIPTEEYLAVRLELLLRDFGPVPDTGAAVARRARLAAVQRRLLERLRAEPGVRGVAAAERLPRMDHFARRVEVEEGRSEPVEVVRVDPGFFDAFDRPILAGRGFDVRDLEGVEATRIRGLSSGVRSTVIVNASFVQEMLGGRNPVGHRIRYLSGLDREPGPWMEIIGVVGDLGTDLMRQDGSGSVYHAAAAGEIHPLYVALQVGRNPTSFTPRLRELAAGVDPELLVVSIGRLSDVYPEDWYLLIGMLVGWTLFVGVLLTLAASGVYAIMAFAVARRRREIGIRTALGARRSDVVATIGRRAAIQLGLGAALGMPVAGWIYFQIRDDPTATLEAFTVAMVPGLGVIGLVGLLACTVPLRRALRVQPTEAMRGVG